MRMIAVETPLRPPSLLAITYAPPAIRPRLRWLLSLDGRLQAVLARNSEAMIIQLRLAWWRDALNAQGSARPKGEPLLAELDLLEPDPALLDAALLIVDAAEVMAVETDIAVYNAATLKRVKAICTAFAIWTACNKAEADLVNDLALWWANQTLTHPAALPRKLRSLSILAMSEHLDADPKKQGPFGAGARLSWHALTGR